MVVAGVEVGWRAARTSGSAVGVGVAGVEAEGVAVPEVDGGVGERRAGAGVEEGDVEVKGDAGFVFGDGRAEELIGDVEGSGLLLGDEGAGERVGEREGSAGEVEGGGGGEAGSEKTAAGEGSVVDGRLQFSRIDDCSDRRGTGGEDYRGIGTSGLRRGPCRASLF